MEALRDKSAAVVVADTVASVRMMIVSTLRGLGFGNVIGVGSLADALNMAQKGAVDWLVTSLFAEERVNALHVLQVARESRGMARMHVSLFVSNAEAAFLPRAFALGALSSHAKGFNANQLQDAFEALLQTGERSGWSPTLVAAEYLRPILVDRQRYDALLKLETSLGQLFPDATALQLKLAEAAIHSGDVQRGRSLLWQVVQRDESLREAAQAVMDRLLGGDGAESRWKSIRPGIAVVVDSDSMALNASKEYLEAAGAKAVYAFSDGESAWKWMQDSEAPDLLVMEWKLPKLSGPRLLQRIRAGGNAKTQVIVNSSLVGRKEQAMLREMGVAMTLEKPTKRNDFLNCLAWVMAQARRPTEATGVELAIKARLADGDADGAAKLLANYVGKADGADPTAKHLEAEIAFHVGDFNAAKDLAMASLQLGGKSVMTLNLLGKSLMQLRDFSNALQVFERANEMSPDSIERLCAMAETHCELGQDDAALDTLGKAQKIDKGNQAVINSSVNIGLATGNATLVAEMIDKVRPSDSMLAYINNRAVAHARAGSFKEGITLYGNALEVIPQDKTHVRAAVLYNLALAHVRSGDTQAAVRVLERAPEVSDTALASKAGSLRQRAKEALQSGKPMKLNLQDGEKPPQAADGAARYQRIAQKVRQVDAKRPVFCCYGVFRDEDPPSELLSALIANPPRMSAQSA
jgi:CheY-like chemotaxis protein